MKYLKSKNELEIHNICKKYNIENYTINSDLSIDVHGCVSLNGAYLDDVIQGKLPLKFGYVQQDFNCSNNNIMTLEGFPHTIGGHFECNGNLLKSLIGCPKIGGSFNCSNNQIESLKGCPEILNDEIYCNNNRITTFIGGPKKVGYMCCNDNLLTNLEGCPDSDGGISLLRNRLVSLRGAKNIMAGNENRKRGIFLRDNNLPKEIMDNMDFINEIIKYQDDYQIWNSDDTLNIERYWMMMDEIVSK